MYRIIQKQVKIKGLIVFFLLCFVCVNPTIAEAKAVSKRKAVPLKISVIKKKVVTVAAKRLIQSDTQLTMPALGRSAFEVGFKNTGTAAWKASDQNSITLRSLAKRESYFYDSSWTGPNTVMPLKSGGAPGELVFFNFVLNAPERPGLYSEHLALFSGATQLPGTDVVIPILVTKAPPQATLASYVVPPQAVLPLSASSTPAFVSQDIIDDIRGAEKSIRIGITYSNDPIQVTASKDYDVRDTSGALLGSVISGSVTTVLYDRATKLYSITMQNTSSTTAYPVRFTGSSIPDQDTIFEILSYSNRPGWSTSINDNKFRGALEVQYASATDRVWVINELLFEQYLKGIGETSNSSPYEYQKALLIAARTYGLYHIQRSTKYAAEHFTISATDADQVYRGYNAELRLPNVTRAVNETRGAIVTYQGTLAVTPYYSQSDGRTRSWGEVWGGGPYPWLVSVSDPGCAGLPMLGHGVGLSARGALLMALEGKGFEEILKYYYTGVEIRRVY